VTARIFKMGVLSVFFYFSYTLIGVRDLRWSYRFKIDPDSISSNKKIIIDF